MTGWRAGFLLGVVAVVGMFSVRTLIFSPPRPDGGDLVILSGIDASVDGQRQKLVDEWNRLHPESHARIESLSTNADAQHSEMVGRAQSGSSGVDVYNLDVTWTAEFAVANYIRPLPDSVDTDGFLAAPLNTARFNGKLWALPFNTDAALLYYNTDVVGSARAGLPQQLPPSGNDMRAMVTVKPELKAGYVGQLDHYEGLTVNALEVIWAAGGDVVDADRRVVIDRPPALAALQHLARGLVGSGPLPPAVLPESQRYNEHDSLLAFQRGDVALMRNWPVAYGQLANGQPGSADFDVAPLPGPSVLGGQNLAIASDSRNPTVAQRLIEFLTSESSERQLFGAGGLPATRAATYQDPSVIQARPYAHILLDAVNGARSRPLTSHYALFSKVLQEVVTYALAHDGALPDDAVARLTNAIGGRLT